MSSKHDSQSRKYMITINNPHKKGYTPDKFKAILTTDTFKSLTYYAMAEEVGSKEETHHVHIFMMFSSPVRFSTVKNVFPEAHIDKCRGSAKQNRDYVFKTGKWENTEKGITSLPETQYESSIMPLESEGKNNDLEKIYEMIKDGFTTTYITDTYPHLFTLGDQIERMRQKLLYEESKEKLRPIFVVYIYGRTGTGKTRFVLKKHSLAQIYKVTDYSHPFDRYNGEKVLFLDEYRSSISLGLMLQLIDIYPVVLPARYSQKMANYEVVYIISNESIHFQYPDLQFSKPESWRAFLRRIHLTINFDEYANKYATFEERYFALSKYIDSHLNARLQEFTIAQEESDARMKMLEDQFIKYQKNNEKPSLSISELSNF